MSADQGPHSESIDRDAAVFALHRARTVGEQRRGDWMQTYTGRQFWPLDPRPEDIALGDIAHALSNLCRFGGHVRRFFSVAEHSLNVVELLPRELALAGLLHDATEAYLVDVPRPIKRDLTNYKAIEERLAEVIAYRFAIDVALFSDPALKRADNIALMNEAEVLLGTKPASWGIAEEPSKQISIECYPPQAAEILFLQAYGRITNAG